MLKVGSVGSRVVEVQKALGIVSDGFFGQKTESAVKEFQRKNNLLVDGVVGDKTLAALNLKKTQKVRYTLSEKGMKMLSDFEGLRLEAYLDSAKIPTIGYGTIKYPNGKKVKLGDKITKEQAVDYKKHDLKGFEDTVNKLVEVDLTQYQYDALVSLSYNIGSGAFELSTLLKKLNKGDYKGAADAFLSWINAGGRKQQGLINRRQKERKVFLYGY